MLGCTIRGHLIHYTYAGRIVFSYTQWLVLCTQDAFHKSSWTLKMMDCTAKAESTKIITLMLNKTEAGLPLCLLEVLYGWMLSQNISISYFLILFCPLFPAIGLTSFQYLNDSKVKWSLPRYTSSLHSKVSKHTCHTKSLINPLFCLVWWS